MYQSIAIWPFRSKLPRSITGPSSAALVAGRARALGPARLVAPPAATRSGPTRRSAARPSSATAGRPGPPPAVRGHRWPVPRPCAGP